MTATTSTQGTAGAKRKAAERLREELRDYAIVAAYLYVCLGILVLYKSAILRGVGVEYLPLGFAAVKALILGKFALLGKAARVGDGGQPPTVLHVIARKTLMFLLLLIVLSVLEEFVAGWLHGRSPAQTLAELGGDPVLALLADAAVLLLVIVPFIAVRETSRALGPGVLLRTLKSRPGLNGDQNHS